MDNPNSRLTLLAHFIGQVSNRDFAALTIGMITAYLLGI